MIISSWNVNGIRAISNKGAFQAYLDEKAPDILFLQETKARREDLPDHVAEPSGYHSVWVSAEKRGYSGVALLSKEKPDLVLEGFGNDRFDSEGRTIIAQYGNLFVIGCYFPNGQRDEERLMYKLDFYDAIFTYANELIELGHHVVICGDYNTAHTEIDLARPKANSGTSGFLPIERQWMDKIIRMGYHDTFRLFNPEPEEYSWWSYRAGARRNNVGWRLDYVFVNDAFKPFVTDAFIQQDVLGSDHCPVGIKVDL